ncbi:MAG: malate dehydrogenase, partial [Bacteroidales bacterium]|nr:malate dehydrogenase [Bacteroidales bacterium]
TASLVSKKNRNQVFGMAGILDTSRFKAFIAAELNVSTRDIQTLILGGHGDTMVPLPNYTTVSGIPISQFLDKEKIDAIVQRTRGGGGEIVKLMGTSAWYAPGAAVAQMVESIVRDQHRILPVCVELKGEYGMKDVFLGVPVKLGKEGIEEIIEVNLNDEEMELLTASCNAVKNVMGVLDNMNMF